MLGFKPSEFKTSCAKIDLVIFYGFDYETTHKCNSILIF